MQNIYDEMLRHKQEHHTKYNFDKERHVNLERMISLFQWPKGTIMMCALSKSEPA